MPLQSQFKSKVLLEKIEPLTVIKNEPEIGIDSLDIKDEIDIIYHIIPQDLIKREPIPTNLFESDQLGSVETQIFVQTENTPFIKTEFENLVKTEDTSNGNLSVESICKDLHEQSHKTERENQHCCNQCNYKTFRLGCFNRHKKVHLKPEEILYFYCYHCSYKSKAKCNIKNHIFRHFKNEEVPFHCYICDFVTVKRHLIIEHFKKHPEHCSIFDETDYKISLKVIKKRYCCKKCMFRTYQYEKFKLHELTHKEMDDQYLKYQCDKCTYKTFRPDSFRVHQLVHLKPEEIQYFYCYHCSYKAKQKKHLKIHILRHFKNEVVPFHCYICDFVTFKRHLIIEHFKKHPEHCSKCDETDYKISLKKKLVVKKRYYCKKCMFSTRQYEKLSLHDLTHKETDDRYLKYQCDKCTYKTFNKGNFKVHQLVHLKPEEIQYFYCYHCSYKSKRKKQLIDHILRHFKNEVVKFHCYMCNFMTLKRESITEHIKKHSQVQANSNIYKRI